MGEVRTKRWNDPIDAADDGTLSPLGDPMNSGGTNPCHLTVHPDGLYYYCANEQDNTVDVFDTRTLQLVQQIRMANKPGG